MSVRPTALLTALAALAFFGTPAMGFDRKKGGEPKNFDAADRAAEEYHEARRGPDHGDHGGHEQRLYGQPQPQDSIPLDPYLFFFTLVLFLGLLYLLNRYAWQPILFHLSERDKRIDEAVRQAEIAGEEMQRLRVEMDKSLAAAHDEVRKTLDQVRADASKDSDALLTKAKEEAAAERSKALEAVEQAKREAQDSLREASVQLAAQMAGKVADRPLDAAAVRKHVTEG